MFESIVNRGLQTLRVPCCPEVKGIGLQPQFSSQVAHLARSNSTCGVSSGPCSLHCRAVTTCDDPTRVPVVNHSRQTSWDGCSSLVPSPSGFAMDLLQSRLAKQIVVITVTTPCERGFHHGTVVCSSDLLCDSIDSPLCPHCRVSPSGFLAFAAQR